MWQILTIFSQNMVNFVNPKPKTSFVSLATPFGNSPSGKISLKQRTLISTMLKFPKN